MKVINFKAPPVAFLSLAIIFCCFCCIEDFQHDDGDVVVGIFV